MSLLLDRPTAHAAARHWPWLVTHGVPDALIGLRLRLLHVDTR